MSETTDTPGHGELQPLPADPLEKMPGAQRVRFLARATHRAMAGSRRVQSEEDWVKIVAEAHRDYESGAFLLERLGAERYLDPKLMATLSELRQRLIAESEITTASEMMFVDLAVMHYALTLRVHGWIGDLALKIEHEFFGDNAFTDLVNGEPRIADRFAVSERVRRLSEQLMPALDRASRMVIRTVKAVKELRQGQVPAIAIGRAEQVTVTSRPQRGLRPVPTELPQLDGMTDRITPGSETRSGADGVAAVPSPKRRARQRTRSGARSPQTPRRRRSH
jgi:hypothetical protein